MVEQRSGGQSWEEIASENGISVRQVRRRVAEAERIAAEEGGLGEVEPLSLLRRIIASQVSALDCTEGLMNGGADNSNAMVAAARSTATIGSALRDSLISAGLLPNRIAIGPGDLLRMEGEARELVLRLVGACEAEGLGSKAIIAAVEDRPLTLAAGAAA